MKTEWTLMKRDADGAEEAVVTGLTRSKAVRRLNSFARGFTNYCCTVAWKDETRAVIRNGYTGGLVVETWIEAKTDTPAFAVLEPTWADRVNEAMAAYFKTGNPSHLEEARRIFAEATK